jgi:hypothetical protein
VLGSGGANPEPDIVVAVIGIVVVAVSRPQVLRIIIVPGAAAHHCRSISLATSKNHILKNKFPQLDRIGMHRMTDPGPNRLAYFLQVRATHFVRFLKSFHFTLESDEIFSLQPPSVGKNHQTEKRRASTRPENPALPVMQGEAKAH